MAVNIQRMAIAFPTGAKTTDPYLILETMILNFRKLKCCVTETVTAHFSVFPRIIRILSIL